MKGELYIRKECPVGERIGGVTVLGEAERVVAKSGQALRRWRVRCDCGVEFVSGAVRVRLGRALRCKACSNALRTKHGCAATRGHRASNEYELWVNLKSRCKNPNNKDWDKYGGRGITLCERWESFENFLADMGPRPSRAHSVERKDNEKGYGPENCIWATTDVQASNRRNSRLLTHDGITLTLTEWSRRIGMSHTALRIRLRTLSIAEALTKPKAHP
jgi:hypothetical protein